MIASSFAGKPSVSLSLCDIHKQPLEQPAVGIPFYLVATVTSEQQIEEAPQIEGLEDFEQGSVHVASTLHVINGVTESTVSYYHTVRCDMQDTYTVGPAVLKLERQISTSEPLEITVGNTPVYDEPQMEQKARLELKAEKDSVFIGEPLKVTMSFCAAEGVQIIQALNADFPGWVIGAVDPSTTREFVRNRERVIEHTLELYQYTPGEHIVPSLSVPCAVPVKRHRMSFLFDDMFGQSKEQIIVQSNACPIRVKPLPSYDGVVHGIGHITRTELSCEHESAKVGEGIVVRLTVSGEGNVEGLEAPPLHLPQGLRYYDSTSSIMRHEYGWDKTFEYVVQASQEGVHGIPEQTYTFFDYTVGEYSTHPTLPHLLKITSALSQSGPVTLQSSSLVQDDPHGGKESLRPLPLHRESSRFAWWLIVLACCAIFGGGGGYGMWRLGRWYRRKYNRQLRYRFAYRRARRRFAVCARDRNPVALYKAWISLFADRCSVSEQEVSELFIEQCLRKIGMEDYLKSWRKDFLRYAEHAFSAKAYDEDLVRSSKVWLQRFEKRL